ncbi:MAG: GPW/gp25 family protein [Dehalococcoidia bacterium]
MVNELVGRGWAFPIGVGGGGGIALAQDLDDIEQAILIILGTSPGERVMRPDFGCRIHELVFDPSMTETLGAAVRYVEEALAWWEPRIEVRDVEAVVDPKDHGRILIHVHYTVRTTKDERSLVFPFYLIEREAE